MVAQPLNSAMIKIAIMIFGVLLTGLLDLFVIAFSPPAFCLALRSAIFNLSTPYYISHFFKSKQFF
jgi:hypothetical protein